MNEGEKNPLNLADQKHFLVFHSYLKYVWLRSESIVRHCNDAMLILLEKSPQNSKVVTLSVFQFSWGTFCKPRAARVVDQTEV